MKWHQNVTVVEFADTLIVSEVMQKVPADDYILVRLSPTVWVIQNSRMPEFSMLLQQNGFKPKILEN